MGVSRGGGQERGTGMARGQEHQPFRISIKANASMNRPRMPPTVKTTHSMRRSSKAEPEVRGNRAQVSAAMRIIRLAEAMTVWP
jgi:hypothetical protein